MVQSGTVDVMLSLSLPLFCLSLSHTHTINSRSCCFSPHPNCPVGGGDNTVKFIKLGVFSSQYQIICCERGHGCFDEGWPELSTAKVSQKPVLK